MDISQQVNLIFFVPANNTKIRLYNMHIVINENELRNVCENPFEAFSYQLLNLVRKVEKGTND